MAAQEFDVLIVGSGHSGGMAANILTAKGISCLMLNAGPQADMARDRVSQTGLRAALPRLRGTGPSPAHLPGQRVQRQPSGWMSAKSPYTCDPDKPYNWVRVRLLGGRSLFWARESFRLSDFEFKAAEIDGTGDSWPISHADLDPYYSRVEGSFPRLRPQRRLAAISRRQLHRYRLRPRQPDHQEGDRAGHRARHRLLQGPRRHRASDGLASSINLLLPDALATGKLEIVPNAIVREITTDKNTGLAERRAFRGPPLAPRDAREGAGGDPGGRLPGKHAPAAQFRNRQFQRRDGPLPHRPDLRHQRDGLRARGARRQSAVRIDGRQRLHAALPQS